MSVNRMFEKVCIATVGLLCACGSTFFMWIVFYVGSSEVLPAIRNGSLNVETSTMILNRVWRGNEIYLLLSAYLLLACGLAFGAFRFLKMAFGRR